MEQKSAWTAKIYLNRDLTEFATFELKDVDYDVYLATQELISKKKMKEAIYMFFREHRIGGDEISKIEGNFVAFQSAQEVLLQILEPVPGEVKKN